MVMGYNAQQADRYFCEQPDDIDLEKELEYLEDKANWDYDNISGN